MGDSTAGTGFEQAQLSFAAASAARLTRPSCIGFRAERMPKALRRRRRWVAWQPQWRGFGVGWAKVPHHPTRLARVPAKPSNAGSLEQVLASVQAADPDSAYGIGFVLDRRDGIVCVDLDDCRDPDSGTVTPAASDIVGALGSYTELSPSGTGLHVWLRGVVPHDRPNLRAPGVEIYSHARFIAVTNHRLPGTPAGIGRSDYALWELVQSLRPTPAKKDHGAVVQACPADVAQVFARLKSAPNAAKYLRLYAGDWQGCGYPSQSEADLAFARIVAFYAAGDARAVEVLFSASGLGRRDKWQRRSEYRRRTIEAAVTHYLETTPPSTPHPEEKTKTTKLCNTVTTCPQTPRLSAVVKQVISEASKPLPGLSPTATRLLGVCRRLQAEQPGEPFFLAQAPSAKELGVSQQAVCKALKALVVAGLLELVKRGKFRSGKASEYRLA